MHLNFIYPNESELQWSILIVLYPFLTGLVAGAFILASLERVFQVEAVKPTYRLASPPSHFFSWRPCPFSCIWDTRSDLWKCILRRTAPPPWPCSASFISGI
jgi:hypothetical protein